MRAAASVTATTLTTLVFAVAAVPPALAAPSTGGAVFGSTSQVSAPVSPATPTTTGGIDPSAPLTPPATPQPQFGETATISANGLATPPAGAPAVVAAIIAAGNAIARKPYVWGGGHRRWTARGYDCSGSVSFALHGAGLLDAPLVSGSFARWGEAGPGSWVTIYANASHVFMVVAGLRFDTSGQRQAGTRWQHVERGVKGFRVRHPAGL